MHSLSTTEAGGVKFSGYNRITMTEIGKVTHYYGKLGVAIIELSAPLKVGDRIKIQGPSSEFEQAVDSMQVDHQAVTEAKKGEVVGVKVVEKAGEGAKAYLLEE